MDGFEVNVNLANPDAPDWTEELSMLVDTRATLSCIPRATLDKLGVKPLSRLSFVNLDGHRSERDTTAVLLTIGARKAAIQVAFGEPDDKAILGLTAVEALGFTVDPVARKLIPRNLRMLCVVEQTSLSTRIAS